MKRVLKSVIVIIVLAASTAASAQGNGGYPTPSGETQLCLVPQRHRKNEQKKECTFHCLDLITLKNVPFYPQCVHIIGTNSTNTMFFMATCSIFHISLNISVLHIVLLPITLVLEREWISKIPVFSLI